MIIKNAKIYTMGEKGIIENGFIKIEDNIIVQVDSMENYDYKENIDDNIGEFESLISSLDDMAMQILIRNLDSKDVLVALKPSGDNIRNLFFNNMSKNAAESLKEEIEYARNIRGRDVEAAKERIINKIYELDKSGEIIISDEVKENTKKINTDVIDAKGRWLLPGFIDAHTHLGMYEDGIRDEGDDLNEVTDPQTPQLRAIDAINPMDRTFTEAMEAGITCVATGPGSANPIGGQFAVIKTYGRRIDDMIVKEPVSIKFALGENPKTCYGNKNQTPETRMATAAIIRENLRKAKKYSDGKIKAKETANTEDPADEPEYDMKCEALLPLISGGLDAHIHAHRADDIFTAVRISKEFSLNYVLVHCTEGHLIADELADENVRAIVGPIICDRSKPEMKNLEISNAKALKDAGILFSLTTDHPVAPLQYLPYCAALTVKGGLDKYEALKAITVNAAKILNIDNLVGSIETGKHADIVLHSGDPLDILSNADIVIIDGKIVKGMI